MKNLSKKLFISVLTALILVSLMQKISFGEEIINCDLQLTDRNMCTITLISSKNTDKKYEFNPYSSFSIDENNNLFKNKKYLKAHLKLISQYFGENNIDEKNIEDEFIKRIITKSVTPIIIDQAKSEIKKLSTDITNYTPKIIKIAYGEKTYDFDPAKIYIYDETGNLSINNNNLNEFMNLIEQEFEQNPENREKIVKKNEKGKYIILENKIDREKLSNQILNKIIKQDFSPLKLPLKLLSYAENAGEKKVILLSKHTTPLDPATEMPGKIYNVRLIGETIGGIKLKPQEVFSFAYYARRVPARYQQGPVIYGTSFGSGYGGGICQVSTTIFNAALESGLEITQRKNHSIPVSYEQRGRDAMVYEGIQDLKIRNNFANEIYIIYEQPADNKSVNVYIYGDKSDKKDVQIVTTGQGKDYGVKSIVNGVDYQSFYSHYLI